MYLVTVMLYGSVQCCVGLQQEIKVFSNTACAGLWLGFILGLSAQNAALLYFILKLDWEDEANDVRKSCFVNNLQS